MGFKAASTEFLTFLCHTVKSNNSLSWSAPSISTWHVLLSFFTTRHIPPTFIPGLEIEGLCWRYSIYWEHFIFYFLMLLLLSMCCLCWVSGFLRWLDDIHCVVCWCVAADSLFGTALSEQFDETGDVSAPLVLVHCTQELEKRLQDTGVYWCRLYVSSWLN